MITPHRDALERDVHVWRVVARDQAAAAFTASRNPKPGRWCGADPRVVYVSDSPGGAVLEFLAHAAPGEVPALSLVQGRVPADAVEAVGTLPADWAAVPYRPAVQAIGDAWAAAGRSYALRVPSAVCPGVDNLLLNCAHANAGQLVTVSHVDFVLDARLAKQDAAR